MRGHRILAAIVAVIGMIPVSTGLASLALSLINLPTDWGFLVGIAAFVAVMLLTVAALYSLVLFVMRPESKEAERNIRELPSARETVDLPRKEKNREYVR